MDIEDILELSEKARPDLDSYRNCGAINRKIRDTLSNEGIECEFVVGNLTRYGLRGEGPEHGFVVITDPSIADSEIIVDGAVRQFSDERKDAGEVWFSLGSEEALPVVAVLQSGDELYEMYQWS